MLDQEIIEQQGQIDAARTSLIQARKNVKDLEQQLKTLAEDRDPEDEEGFEQQQAELLGQWDDGMDELEVCEQTLQAQLEIYANMEPIAALPAKQEELANHTANFKSLKKNLKVAKIGQKQLQAQKDRAEVELNAEGFAQFATDLQARIEAAQARIEALNNVEEEEEPEEEGYQSPNTPYYTVEEEEALIETLEKVLSNLTETNSQLNANLNAVTEQLNGQNTLVGNLQVQLDEVSSLRDEVKATIDPYSDPRDTISLLHDNTPFLLLPLRLETRFVTVKHGYEEAGAIGPIPDAKELWIRIFPDDLAANTHEDMLSADELEKGKIYWAEFWNEADLQLGAWRILSGIYGPERAAWIARQTRPTNVLEEPKPAAPEFEDLDTKDSSWTERAESYVMPERFVARVYKEDGVVPKEYLGEVIPDPLPLGMGPEDDAFDQLGDEVEFPEELAWLSDFQKAVKVGMGIKVRFADFETSSVQKIIVLGIKLSANKATATGLLEELIDNHHYTDGGFSLVPQGTPTNNTEEVKTPYEGYESDATVSFGVEQSDPLFTTDTNLLSKADGQWFANLLGIDEAKLQHIRNADGKDVAEGLAMNHALWPATMGYYIKQMLHPQTGLTEHEQLRAFFNEYVIGRGKVPAFRVDNQPYGVIVSSAFSRWSYGAGNSTAGFYKSLYSELLQPLNTVWQKCADEYVKGMDIHSPPSDPSPEFMDLLGLHASSVDFHQRIAMGDHSMWNISRYLNLSDPENPGEGGLGEGLDQNTTVDTFTNAFFTPYLSSPPKVFELNFLDKETPLTGPVVDNYDPLPYSETRGVAPLPGKDANYMEWLMDASTTVSNLKDEIFDNLEGEAGEVSPPRALLYLMLRYAMLKQYIDTAIELLVMNDIISPEAAFETELKNIDSSEGLSVEEKELIRKSVSEKLTQNTKTQAFDQVETENPEATRRDKRTLKTELFNELSTELPDQIESEIQQKEEAHSTEKSKWDYLLKVYEGLTDGLDMGAYLQQLLEGDHPDVADIQELRMALQVLKNLPTARLERIFAEHLDTCNYRLDSWFSGLALQRLEAQQEAEKGIYLGAFGILENIKENPDFPGIYPQEVEANGEPIEPSSNRGLVEFHYVGNVPLPSYNYERVQDTGLIRVDPVEDTTNEGFIHTPSLNHATTAAILRAGFLTHKNAQSDPEALSVNLTSARVRHAFFYLDGIQKGQSLAEMLGYRFERNIYEQETSFSGAYTIAEYLQKIRDEYPLEAGSILPLEPVSVENQEGRQVVHGSDLIEAYKLNSAVLSSVIDNSGDLSVINSIIRHLIDDMDALSDVLLSEGVYQMARGNVERSGAVMKSLSEGGFIQEPEILKTPRLSKAFTNRVGITFDPIRSAYDAWSRTGTPRSNAEPGLNGWLADKLPAAIDITINYYYTVHSDTSGTETHGSICMEDLDIEPIDLIYMVQAGGLSEALSELSKRISFYVKKYVENRDDITVNVQYKSRVSFVGAQISVYEILSLLQELKTMVGNSRAMNPEDFLLPDQIQDDLAPEVSFQQLSFNGLENRLKQVVGITSGYSNSIADLITKITNEITLVSGGDLTKLSDLRESLVLAANYGIANAVPNTAAEDTDDLATVLLAKAADVKKILLDRESEATAILNNIPSYTTPNFTESKAVSTQLEDAAKIIFGNGFKVYRDFGLRNATEVEIQSTQKDFFADAGDLAAQRWVQGVAKVRSRITNFQRVQLYGDYLKNRRRQDLSVIQLPLSPTRDDRWVAMEFNNDYEVPDDSISMVLDAPNMVDMRALQAGMIIDDWVETIPDPDVQSGVAMNYQSPNSEAPNALILAVSPNETGRWEWSDLMDVVDETFGMAKKRAVEPDHLKEKIWGQVVPALVGPIDPADTMPSLDFRKNNAEG